MQLIFGMFWHHWESRAASYIAIGIRQVRTSINILRCLEHGASWYIPMFVHIRQTTQQSHLRVIVLCRSPSHGGREFSNADHQTCKIGGGIGIDN